MLLYPYKKWSLYLFPSNLGWACGLLWTIRWQRSDAEGLPRLGLKKLTVLPFWNPVALTHCLKMICYATQNWHTLTHDPYVRQVYKHTWANELPKIYLFRMIHIQLFKQNNNNNKKTTYFFRKQNYPFIPRLISTKFFKLVLQYIVCCIS